MSIALGRPGSLVPLNAVSHRSQALCLLVKRVNFLVEPRHLRFWRIGAAQLFERLADGEFGYFSHGKILFRRRMSSYSRGFWLNNR
ncbi:MAG: hypothetical protein WBM06_00490 [Pseudolabrys sp.]